MKSSPDAVIVLPADTWRVGARIVPADALLRERAEAARRRLEPHAFADLREEGRSLSLEAAVELAEVEVLGSSAS
uniref:Uncharacterized protein n=1 Tax=uncultured Nocardioidaceae bacterium TaxID=253824 RepID=A0A6J4M850_9ACTN|nr:MAG: hypothetical protein AVDCRST_MAG46-2649 [uncultured Nocardioidaceae bacterium]